MFYVAHFTVAVITFSDVAHSVVPKLYSQNNNELRRKLFFIVESAQHSHKNATSVCFVTIIAKKKMDKKQRNTYVTASQTPCKGLFLTL